MITEGDVEDIGIINISYSVYINSDHFADQDDSLGVPVRIYDDSFLMYLYRNDRIVCTGSVDAIFEVEGIPQNETINFEISTILPINILSYSYEIHFPLVWLEIIIFVVIFVFLYVSFRIVKSILHELRYVDNIKEKDTKFFTYMKKRNDPPPK